MRTTSGRVSVASRTRGLAVGRRRRPPRCPRPRRAAPVTPAREQRVVVDDEHAQRGHDGFLGSTARTTVPPPGRGSSSSEPPSSSARSRIVSRPDPSARAERSRAVVGDADHQVSRCGPATDTSHSRAPGMAQHVGQRLLHDPVGGDLDGGGGGVGVLGHQAHVGTVRAGRGRPAAAASRPGRARRARPAAARRPAGGRRRSSPARRSASRAAAGRRRAGCGRCPASG